MPSVTCPCGTRFEAQSPRATYCSATCRKRGSRAGLKAAPTTAPAPAPRVAPIPDAPRDPVDVGSVVGAVVAELNASNALHSAAGLAALRLAELIDMATTLNGSSVAAWTREMRAALSEAKAGAPAQESDPLDDLERKRAARRGA